MKLFSIKRETLSYGYNTGATTIYKCLFGFKLFILHKYKIRKIMYTIPGCGQNIYPPASRRLCNEYISKKLFIRII